MSHVPGPAPAIKRIARVACLVLLTAALSGCGTSSNPNSPDSPKALIIASGHPEWPPIMYRSGSVIDGAGPALVKKIFDDLGVPVEFPQTGTWDEVQAKARTGQVDILVAAY